MSTRKLQVVLLVMLMTVLISTVAYAYVGPDLGSRNLRYGLIGGDVQELQTFLNNNKFFVGLMDGIFGRKTENGVVGFQKKSGITADGIAGPQTFAAIRDTGSSRTSYTVVSGDTLYSIAARTGATINSIKETNGLKSDTIYPGQNLIISKISSPVNPPSSKPLKVVLQEKGITGPIPNFKIVVDKSDHLLTLYSGGTILKSYGVGLGDGGEGDKQKAGDHKTPEGTFYIAERSVLSPSDRYLGSRWMRVSYPNIEDAQRGLESGLIDQSSYREIVRANNNHGIPPQKTALGGGIGIHGGSGTYDNTGDHWTWGCVALTNANVNEIYDYIPVGTKLVIQQ